MSAAQAMLEWQPDLDAIRDDDSTVRFSGSVWIDDISSARPVFGEISLAGVAGDGHPLYRLFCEYADREDADALMVAGEISAPSMRLACERANALTQHYHANPPADLFDQCPSREELLDIVKTIEEQDDSPSPSP